MADAERLYLYDNTVVIDYWDNSHRYFLVGEGGKKTSLPSVSTICGVLDKPALVPWAVNKTIDYLKTAIKPDEEYSEALLDEIWKVAKKANVEIKEDAADIGHSVHAILHDGTQDENANDPRVESGVKAGRSWLETNEVETISSESMVFSKKHTVVGRLDRIVKVQGALCLADWKTSNGVWPEMVMQVSAYKAMWEEESGQRLHKVYLIHLDKETGEFHPYEFSHTYMQRVYKNGFLPALKLYRAVKDIKGKLK